MPGLESTGVYELRCQRLRERRAKLIAKGINPRSLKFSKLLYRRCK